MNLYVALLLLIVSLTTKILFEISDLLFKESDSLLDGLPAHGIKERRYFHGALEVL